MTKHWIQNGNHVKESKLGERPKLHRRNWVPEHPFAERLKETLEHSDAPSIYGVHIYTQTGDVKHEGFVIDYEPNSGGAALLDKNYGMKRWLKRRGFIVEPKEDGRFRFNESDYAIVVVGHEILGPRLPSDLDLKAEAIDP